MTFAATRDHLILITHGKLTTKFSSFHTKTFIRWYKAMFHVMHFKNLRGLTIVTPNYGEKICWCRGLMGRVESYQVLRFIQDYSFQRCCYTVQLRAICLVKFSTTWLRKRYEKSYMKHVTFCDHSRTRKIANSKVLKDTN